MAGASPAVGHLPGHLVLFLSVVVHDVDVEAVEVGGTNAVRVEPTNLDFGLVDCTQRAGNQPMVITNSGPSMLYRLNLGKGSASSFQLYTNVGGAPGALITLGTQIALATADYGYVLEVGRIVMEDTCAKLMEKEDIKEFYLGMKEDSARGNRRWKKKKTWR